MASAAGDKTGACPALRGETGWIKRLYIASVNLIINKIIRDECGKLWGTDSSEKF